MKKKEDKNSYSQSQIEEIKKISWQDGYNQAMSEIDRENQKTQEIKKELFANLLNNFSDLITKIDDIKNENSIIVMNIIINIAKKLVGNLLIENSEALLINNIKNCLPLISKEPTIKITVNPKFIDTITEKIEELKIGSNFKGNIVLCTDNNLHEINCLVEWENGMIENNYDLVWSEIEKIISKV